MTLKSDAKFEEKLICCFRNDKNLVNFDLSTQNSQNVHFDWFLLREVYNVLPKNVLRSCISWHWRVMQNLMKTRQVRKAGVRWQVPGVQVRGVRCQVSGVKCQVSGARLPVLGARFQGCQVPGSQGLCQVLWIRCSVEMTKTFTLKMVYPLGKEQTYFTSQRKLPALTDTFFTTLIFSLCKCLNCL